MKKIAARLILVADATPTMWDRIKYLWSIFMYSAPVVFILDLANWWFTENKQFGTFMCIALIINMIIGAWMHLMNKTFNFKDFFLKNLEMSAVVIIVYIMLEMLRYTAGANIAGEIFRISIQVMTLIYPTSKVFKNVFIISNGKYPPEFIMKRMYDFERNGDLSKFFTKDIDEEYLERLVKEKKQRARDIADPVHEEVGDDI